MGSAIKKAGKWWMVLAAAVLPAVLCGQQVEFERFVMPSGLRVLVHPDHRSPVVSVALLYRSGLNDEPSTLVGVNRVVAGMLTESTGHLSPGEYRSILETYGGETSVEVAPDVVFFSDSFSSNLLKGAIWLASERAYGFREDTAAYQQVLEQIRREDAARSEDLSGREDEALRGMVRTVNLRLVPEVAALDSGMTMQAAKAYESLYFSPKKAVLAISGDVHPDSVRKYVVEMFSLLPPDTVQVELNPTVFSVGDAVADTVVLSDGKAVDVGGGILTTVEQRRHADTLIVDPEDRSVVFAWQVLPYSDHQFGVFDFIGTVLAAPDGSRLFRRLVEEEDLATDVGYKVLPMERASVFAVKVSLKPGAEIARVEETVRQELERMKNFDISPAELTKALNTARMSAWESISSNQGMARTLALNELLFGDAAQLNRRMEQLSAYTQEDVRTVVRRFLRNDNMKTIYELPSSQGAD